MKLISLIFLALLLAVAIKLISTNILLLELMGIIFCGVFVWQIISLIYPYLSEENIDDGIPRCRKDKLKFKTKESAWKKAIKLNEKFGWNYQVYRCSNHWHLTTSNVTVPPQKLIK